MIGSTMHPWGIETARLFNPRRCAVVQLRAPSNPRCGKLVQSQKGRLRSCLGMVYLASSTEIKQGRIGALTACLSPVVTQNRPPQNGKLILGFQLNRPPETHPQDKTHLLAIGNLRLSQGPWDAMRHQARFKTIEWLLPVYTTQLSKHTLRNQSTYQRPII